MASTINTSIFAIISKVTINFSISVNFNNTIKNSITTIYFSIRALTGPKAAVFSGNTMTWLSSHGGPLGPPGWLHQQPARLRGPDWP